MAPLSFRLEETTIDRIHAALRGGHITARQLVEAYLARIEAYDRKGPELKAIITVNPQALDEADALHRAFRERGTLTGPLHGVPVLLKDQFETRGLRTTFGSIALKDYVPSADAHLVERLRAAGAIILAKTTLPDFATAWFAFCSAGGETRNPYALDRDPGGSSSGTAAGVAANLGAVGIGEDTGGSIRLPASFTNLVGLRVTTGLISRSGASPLVYFQDTAGPMTRTVRDAAILLDTLVGYDPRDPFTAVVASARRPASYTAELREDGLRGARIGVLRQAFGADDDPESGPVNRVVNQAIDDLRSLGAEVIDPVSIPDLQDFIAETSLYLLQSKHDINAFLAARPSAPVRTVEEIYASKQFHPSLDLFEGIAQGPDHPEEHPEYFRRLTAQTRFQRAVLNVLAAHRLDALLYPDVQVLPPRQRDLGKWTTLTFPTNTLIAAQTSLPAISVPAGFTDDGIPVGIELVGSPFAEPTLLRLAYAFERATGHRRPPATTPPLPGEP
ncbi:MAG: amidase family protein [Sphaerobacter sp.]|nr:amidase family protein [Sphaerobacter sp.]